MPPPALRALNTRFSLVGNSCAGVLPRGTCAITAQMGTATGGTYSQGGIAVSDASTGNRADLSLGGTVVALTTLGGSPRRWPLAR